MHIYTNITLTHYNLKIKILFISCYLPDSLLVQEKNNLVLD